VTAPLLPIRPRRRDPRRQRHFYTHERKDGLMLVLTSRQGEDVIITVPGLDSPIVVRLIESGTGKARLGFQADASVTIDRAKVHQDKCRRRREGGAA
jgi:sRNA-binding carbon storage regulator CsrA